MLKKMVDGVEIILSDEEEAHVRAWWAFNEKYPEYHDCNRYDGASAPVIDIPRARELHVWNVNKVINEKLEVLRPQIEQAEDDGDDDTRAKLIARRKMLKGYLDRDVSHFDNVEGMYEHLNSIKGL
jgi:hypothetical protein